MKILDCTLRDGGYYTNWDFHDDIVKNYAQTMEQLPIDYVEVGYRSVPLHGYLGKYFYCPIEVLENLKKWMPTKKLVIILNEKDIRAEHVEQLLGPVIPFITMVRIAIDPKNFERAISLAKAVKKLGFEVGFNVMYMSNWKENNSFLDLLKGMDDTIDYFYMVDSFGGVMPHDLREIIHMVREKTKIPLGFHGHNNLEMAFSNTLTALEEGCEMIDATITGMGRGAGNLKTELFLTYLESENKISGEYDKLSNVVAQFEKLKGKYRWGTNLPYMFSGAHSLPQKQVMEWVGLNRYPLGSILNALNNQKKLLKDNFQLPYFRKSKRFQKAIILGGGPSAIEHYRAIKRLAEFDPKLCIIHAGARHAARFTSVECEQFYALVGFESRKLLSQIHDPSNLNQICIYPPFPRKMGTLIPEEILNISRELVDIKFTQKSVDSPMAIAIQTGLDLGVETIYLAGFDGYNTELSQLQLSLAQENQKIIDDLLLVEKLQVFSVTPTKYRNLDSISVYSLTQ